MYGSVFYDKKHSIIYWSEYDENNVRNEFNKKWVPDFYIKSNKPTRFKSQKNEDLLQLIDSTYNKRQKHINECKELNLQVFGSDLSPENKFILEQWPNDIISTPDIRYLMFDIETETENGFPDEETVEERINVITAWSSVNKKFHTFGLEKDFNNTFNDVIYKKFETEEELLIGYLDFLQTNRHEIWSGWHSDGFDTPYIFNRILKILDHVNLKEYNDLIRLLKTTKDNELRNKYREDLDEINKTLSYVNKLSLFSHVEKKAKLVKDPFTKEMKPAIGYEISGITDYDLLRLDQRFRQGKRDSYTLDNVAFDELSENKTDYEGSLKDLYTNNWNKFVEYNIQDVRLIEKLNHKLNYIPLAIYLSYKCHCQFKDNFGTVQKVETAIYNFLKKDNIIMEDRKENVDDSQGTVPGAYVTPKTELKRGKHYWIIDADVSSLYPSLMRGINISYDTKLAKINSNKHIFSLNNNDEISITDNENKTVNTKVKNIVSLIKSKNYQVSSNNVIFKNVKKKKGILIKILDMWYAQRKTDQKKWLELRDNALTVFKNAQNNETGNKVSENIDNKKIIKKLNDEDYKNYNEITRLSNIYYNKQWASKILLNSIYGCLASKFFRFYDFDLAAAITLSGRTVSKSNALMLNKFLTDEIYEHEEFKTYNINKDITICNPVLYQDTDSIFLTLDKVLSKLSIPDDDSIKLLEIRKISKIILSQLEKFNKQFFPEYFNAENTIFFEQELIAKSGIWCQPKKYVCYIIEEKGKPPKDDMLRKGLDIVRSSIPRKFKIKLKEIINMMLKDVTQKEINDYIAKLYIEFKSWSIDDIAVPVSCNNLKKYSCQNLNFLLSTPQHMKGAIAFNYYINTLNLKSYEQIKERDKFKLLFLNKNSIYPIEVLGYKDVLPKELNVEPLINWNRHFDRGFNKPISQLFDALNWKFPEFKNKCHEISDLFQ